MNILAKIREIICTDLQKELATLDVQYTRMEQIARLEHWARVKLDAELGEYINITGIIPERLTKASKYFTDFKCPEWLDASRPFYHPQIDIPKIENGKVVTKRVLYSPQDLYIVTPTIYKLAKEIVSNLPPTHTDYEEIYTIWKYVVEKWTYAYDKGEFWEPAFIAINEKKFDCETGTILFMTLLRARQINSHKIFNATGWVYDSKGKQLYGHSYPVVYLDEDIGWTGTEGWYVFETTIDKTPKYPQKWSLIPYGADWGLHNWRFGGQIKPEFWAEGSKYPRM